MQIVFEITKEELPPGSTNVPKYVLGIQANITTPLEADFVLKGLEALKALVEAPLMIADKNLLESIGFVPYVHGRSFREAGQDNPSPPEPPTPSPEKDPLPTVFDPNEATDEQIRSKIEELKKANKEAPRWGAAVGARVEWIKELERVLERRRREAEAKRL